MAQITCYTYDNGTLLKKGIIDDFVSFVFNRSYSNIGEWTLVLNGNSLNTQRIKGMQIISLKDGVAGLVTKYEEANIDNEYTATYTGIELKGISSLRLIIPASGSAYQSYTNQSPEYIIAQLITQHIINPTDTNRAITSSLAAYTQGAESVNFNGRFQNVAEAIQTIANTYNIGWYADIQDGAIVWHIYRGIDRKKNQSANSRMIVSHALDSFGNSALNNINLLPNVALVAGQGEGVDRDTTIVGSGTGLNRSEIYVDARDIESSAELPARGADKLAEYGDNLTYEATFSNYFNSFYRNPYELGDIGTIEDDRLETGEVDFRLTSITEIYEENMLRLDVIFGYDKQGLIETINRSTGNTQALINAEGLGSGAGASQSIAGSFTNADLVSGVLTITHTLGDIILPYAIVDNTNIFAIPDNITYSNNQILLDFSSQGAIAGTWKYSFGGSGSGATGNYLPLTGGTLSGDITVQAVSDGTSRLYLTEHPGSLSPPYGLLMSYDGSINECALGSKQGTSYFKAISWARGSRNVNMGGDISVPSNSKVIFEGSGGNTYITYNSTTGDIEFYKNGSIVVAW